MLFTEALAQLKKGHYVTRNGWDDGYLAYLPRMQYLWKVQSVPNIGAGNWLAAVADYDADDWTLLSKDAVVAVPVVQTQGVSSAA
jgi:hypothetical protein